MSIAVPLSDTVQATEPSDSSKDLPSSPTTALGTADEDESSSKLKKDPRYPLRVAYCDACGLPAEVHEYLSRAQFDKCRDWLRSHAPDLFPNEFPEEAAERLERLRLREQEGGPADLDVQDDESDENDVGVKVAVPIEQKGTVGKKKKLAPEVVILLAQRKGKKQVTVVYGLDLFGIKLSDAAKASKKKFATGASVARSADNRDVVEIQGTRQQDFAELAHKEFGIPKSAVFIADTKKKTKINAFSG